MDQKLLIESIDSYERVLRNVLLATIETLVPIEFVAICNEMLLLLRAKQMTTNNLAKHFVLITCKALLKSIDLLDIVRKFNAERMSAYRYWLFLDAIAARISIHQHLGESHDMIGYDMIV